MGKIPPHQILKINQYSGLLDVRGRNCNILLFRDSEVQRNVLSTSGEFTRVVQEKSNKNNQFYKTPCLENHFILYPRSMVFVRVNYCTYDDDDGKLFIFNSFKFSHILQFPAKRSLRNSVEQIVDEVSTVTPQYRLTNFLELGEVSHQNLLHGLLPEVLSGRLHQVLYVELHGVLVCKHDSECIYSTISLSRNGYMDGYMDDGGGYLGAKY